MPRASAARLVPARLAANASSLLAERQRRALRERLAAEIKDKVEFGVRALAVEVPR